jgi:hypothetical protein
MTKGDILFWHWKLIDLGGQMLDQTHTDSGLDFQPMVAVN